MSVKNDNEITVKITISLDEFVRFLKDSGYEVIRNFILDDRYFVPNDLYNNIMMNKEKMKNSNENRNENECQSNDISVREILKKSILARHIINDEKGVNKVINMLTYKIKNISDEGEILSQKAINLSVNSIEEAEAFLEAIGYKKLMAIYENCEVYSKDNFEIAVKNIKDGDLLIEIEPNEEYSTIESMKERILSDGIPFDKSNYFVKKAEIQLEKVINELN